MLAILGVLLPSPFPSRAVNLVIWATIGGLLLGWQAVTLWQRRLPSFGIVLAVLRRWRWPRWLMLFGWLWLGWHVFVRGGFV